MSAVARSDAPVFVGEEQRRRAHYALRRLPQLGKHNEYICKELLGYSDEEYARLEAEGHIGTEPAPHIP